MRIRIGLDQLRGDAHVLAGAAHAALEHGTDAELSRDGRDIDFLALEHERRSTRGNFQLRQFGQQVENFLGNAVAEIFVLRIPAHVDEGQHGNTAAIIVGFGGRLG
jgi:hypothetical protein